MIKKIAKWAGYILAAAFIVSYVALCATVAKRNAQIREYKSQLSACEETISEKNEMISKLAAMEAVRCEVAITVKNTAVMGANKNGDISQDAYQIATYLRGEILDELRNSK